MTKTILVIPSRTNKKQDPNYSKEYYRKNRDRIRTRVTKWRKDNIERVKLMDRNKHYQRKFGITLQEFEAILEKQKRVCALCEQVCKAWEHLAVDHDHTTGRIRGLLCFKCNTALAQFEDFNLFKKAAEYVQNNIGNS